MGIKRKIIETAIRQVQYSAYKQSKPKEACIQKENKQGEMHPASEYVKKEKEESLLIQRTTFYMEKLKDYQGKDKSKFSDYRGCYQIFDSLGQLQYVILEKFISFSSLEKLFLFDLQGKELGSIIEAGISLKTPLIENESKTVKVSINGKKLCNVRKCWSFGKKHYDLSDGAYCLEEKEKMLYTIKKGSKVFAKVKIFPYQFKKGFTQQIAITIKNKTMSTEAILISCAMDALNHIQSE